MIKADLAGVAIEDVNLEVRGRTLVISGERKARDTEGRVYQQIEIEHGPFQREIQLGVDVVADAGPRDVRGRHPARRAAGRRPRRGARQVPISTPRRGERGRIVIEVVEGGPETIEEIGADASLPDALPVLPLRETVAFPQHDDAAGRRPGAVRAARERRARRATACW